MTLDHIPDIGSRQIAAVLAVAEYRSFIAAAAALRTSQPALTRTIKRVEDVLGVRLFERTTRSVRVTEAGREFVAVAQRMANDLRITVQSMREYADQQRGQVIVTAIMSVANGVLPKAVAAYRQERPGIEIQVRDGIHGSVLDDVKSGAADFGINYLNEISDGIDGELLGQGQFDLVTRRDHPFGQSGRLRIKFDALADVPLISLPPESQTRRVLDATASVQNVRLNHAVVVAQVPTLLGFVRAGVGVGLVPSAAISGGLEDDLLRLTVQDPKISLDIGIVRLKDRALTPAADGLLSAIKKHWPNN